MKELKVEQNDLEELISTENSNSKDKNEGTNPKKVINFYDYTNDKHKLQILIFNLKIKNC